MTARPKLAPEQQMTIEEFLAFTDTRPEEERWELIEGVPVLNPSPIDYHQIVVTNIVGVPDVRTRSRRTRHGSRCIGTGTRVPVSIAQPPAARRDGEGAAATGSAGHRTTPWCCSRSSRRATPRPTRLAAARLCQRAELPALRDRVAQGASRCRLRPRQQLAKSAASTSLATALALPALGLAIPVADIYRWTPLGQSDTQ